MNIVKLWVQWLLIRVTTTRIMTVALCLGFCLPVVCLSAAFGQSSGKTVRHYKVAEPSSTPPEVAEAESALEKHDFASAETLLKKVVAEDPKNYQGWFDLGFTYNALGKTPESIAAYRQSVAAKPDVFESNFNLGIMLAHSGQPDAEQYLRAATTLQPTANVDEGHYRAWLSLGHLLAKSSPDQAIAAFHQASQLQPKAPDPHISAAPLLADENHFADAEQEYKQALAIDPKSKEALTGLANIYMRGHRFGEAEDILHKLVALRPDDSNAHLQLGNMLVADGQPDAAIPELQTAARFAPTNSVVLRELANAYLAAGKLQQAEDQFRTLLTFSPNDAVLHRDLGESLLKEHKFPEAQKEFMAAVQLKPDYGEAYGDLAFAANENKNFGLTIKALDLRAKFLPELPATYFLRAVAYDHFRDNKNAAANYHKFLETDGGKNPDQEWQAQHRLLAVEHK